MNDTVRCGLRVHKLRSTLGGVAGLMFSFQLFSQLLVSGIVIGSSYALLSVSFGIIYATTRIFHFAHAMVYTIAAYGAVTGLDKLGLPWWLSLVVGLAAAVILGVAIEVGAYRPMRRRGASTLALFLTSLGLTIAGSNLIQIAFGSENRPLPGFPMKTFQVGSVTFTSLHLTIVVVSWLLIGGLTVFLRATKYGRATRAAQSNPQMAMAVGIQMEKVSLVVFALGSLLVAVSALLFTLGGVASPNMGMSPILIGFIGVFLGGIGSVSGAALGGLVLGLATSLSGLWLSGDFSPVVVFGLMFVLIILRPQGLLGKAVR